MCDNNPTTAFLGALDCLAESYLGYFRRASSEGGLFFSNGYGDMDPVMELRRLYRQDIRNGTVTFRLNDDDMEWRERVRHENVFVTEGYFQSPLHEILPQESKRCRFHLVQPLHYHHDNSSGTARSTTNPIVYVIMLASTGEAGKKSRLAMAQELAIEQGYASIILTSPYYGHRKPSGQPSFYLQEVTDLWKQFGGTIQAAAALAEYFCRINHRARICFTGFSAGGALAICSAWAALEGYRMDGSRLGVAAYVAPASAGIYAKGSIQGLVDWKALKGIKTEESHVTKQRLYENLDLLSVSSITGIEDSTGTTPQRQLGSIYFCAALRDSFSPSYFARILEEQLPPLVHDPAHCVIEWYPFGHVYAGLARPRLQKKLIVNAVRPLLS